MGSLKLKAPPSGLMVDLPNWSSGASKTYPFIDGAW